MILWSLAFGFLIIILGFFLSSSNKKMDITNHKNNFEGVDADVRIVHISDTHDQHHMLTDSLPKGDILIHTGDFANEGDEEEYERFNKWLGEIKDRYKHGVYMVLGNHDYKFLDKKMPDNEETKKLIDIMANDEKRREHMQLKLSNAILLDFERKEIPIDDKLQLSLFGCPWQPFQSCPTSPDKLKGNNKTGHNRVFDIVKENFSQDQKEKWEKKRAFRYDDIQRSDILLTHIPPYGIFDKVFVICWGSSKPLLEVIKKLKPRAHLFGHVHGQRGFWEKKEGEEGRILGGVQCDKKTYEEEVKEVMEEGVQFIANSALVSRAQIAAPPRLISGKWIEENGEGKWWFHDINGFNDD